MYYQTIDDDDEDILAAILSASDAAPKYNPDLLKGASDQQVCQRLLRYIENAVAYTVTLLLSGGPMTWPHHQHLLDFENHEQCTPCLHELLRPNTCADRVAANF